ncbi:hypothetical protein BN7_3411 [Wickerhamomyces ciferrii]|uniref:Uncharacterized protein n=1 Tax=Wickerhamomyces ciferrii (strain ATCC 14091 / BCRC 22168 / CBS 111 / JCM 3599 / NBRC 0793 / NRRL Y-1031 F-60-10) TaxID=1206466 RepID=K0KNV4_WICCF|nr:uncharacterized protein BN7_3411 [Wickerhamomyces ciferrii]CCH43857.1 hypothetical protein BN7_3411 [Wickerhamomyces ciferrii]
MRSDDLTSAINSILIFVTFSGCKLFESICDSSEEDLTDALINLNQNVRDINGEILSYESFKHFNKNLKFKENSIKERYPIYAGEDFLQLQDSLVGKERWAMFWYKVYKFQTSSLGSLEALQMFNLGLRDHKFIFPVELIPEFPRLRLPFCSLCQELDVTEDIIHLFQDCPISKQVWEVLSTDNRSPLISSLVAPHLANKQQLLLLSKFIGIVWALRQSRRRVREVPSISPQHILAEVTRFLKTENQMVRTYSHQR